ncbi:MAG TPA: translation initiation factor IF-2 N-terminal domain-containing protein, partial [Candidatus Polarisedimenticolia bacterium]|nr:translation initiation factor IF-2 N-terminal domain-containing protein [Candidatus Polarisedimenticolia bacterium]
MAKIRIHELAKRVGLPTKEVVERLRAQGVEVRSNLSSVDEESDTRLKAAPAAAAPAPPSRRPAAKGSEDKPPAPPAQARA